MDQWLKRLRGVLSRLRISWPLSASDGGKRWLWTAVVVMMLSGSSLLSLQSFDADGSKKICWRRGHSERCSMSSTKGRRNHQRAPGQVCVESGCCRKRGRWQQKGSRAAELRYVVPGRKEGGGERQRSKGTRVGTGSLRKGNLNCRRNERVVQDPDGDVWQAMFSQRLGVGARQPLAGRLARWKTGLACLQ